MKIPVSIYFPILFHLYYSVCDLYMTRLIPSDGQQFLKSFTCQKNYLWEFLRIARSLNLEKILRKRQFYRSEKQIVNLRLVYFSMIG